MTQPNGGSEPASGQMSELEAYIRSNRARFTEDALRRAALAAGHQPEAIDAVLARTREAGPPVDRGLVVRNLFVAYLAVYLVLDALILINPANSRGDGFLGDVRGLGIMVLSAALIAAFVASLIWVASRRAFIGLLGLGVAVWGLTSISSSGSGVLIGIGGLAVGAALTFAAARAGRDSTPASPSRDLLMLVPILLLLAVGGTCVVSGLPIPRPA